MKRVRNKVAILSCNAGVLLDYAKLFNEIELYAISLFDDPSGLIGRIKSGTRYRILVIEGFDRELHKKSLLEVVRYSAITSILLTVDMNSKQRKATFNWAKQERIPLLGILQVPLRQEDLSACLESYAYVGTHVAAR